MQPFTIWMDVPVIVEEKVWHKHTNKGKVHRDFVKCYGDIPIGQLNPITGVIMQCVNNRGIAYAARKRKAYRRKKEI